MRQDFQSILSAIRQGETACGRAPHSVSLLAVSKGQSIEKIKAVYEQGQRLFGENYLQEAVEKIEALKDTDIEWHFIGRIQSNKTKAIATYFDWVQSVADLKIAQRLNAQRPSTQAPLNVCIQVNISEVSNKAGILPSQLLSFAQSLKPLKKLRLRGIMIMPEAEANIEGQINVFQKAQRLYQQLLSAGFSCDTLSMGMSGDFKSAIQAGSTLVRIGSAIFGERG